MIKVKEKFKEFINFVIIYRFGGFFILFFILNLVEIGVSD